MSQEENRRKGLEAIELIKKTECETDVLDAIVAKEEIDLHHRDESKIIYLDSREEIYRRILDRK